MRLVRVALFLACALAAASLGCGKKGHAAAHNAGAAAVAAPPTPDNTPIAVLRTPAGWLLVKAEPTATPATPTPAAAAASNPKP
jgi:hypothetical protein